MPLHTSTKPDWQDIPADKRNFWQRYAAATRGVLAPANLLSVVGAVMVIYGLFLLLDHQTIILGVCLILLGRLADVADGFVADKTGTKSPFGEATDATIDKILLGLALIFFLVGQIIPTVVTLILLTHAAFNTLVGFAGYFRRLPVHPSRYGKYATAAEWLSISLFVLLNVISNDMLQIMAWLSLGVFILLAVPSSLSYLKLYTQSSHGK